jgi:adenylate cyclase, class 2
MKEIEVKILEIDKEKILEQLLAFGAVKVAEGEIYSTFFDFSDGTLKKNKKSLRLRNHNNRKFMTYKAHISQVGTKQEEEFEVDVSSLDEMENILKNIGIDRVDELKGKRTSYKLGKISFEFDEYDGIPSYMEIEAQSEEEINAWVQKLGINKEKVTPWGSRELFAHYGKILYY